MAPAKTILGARTAVVALAVTRKQALVGATTCFPWGTGRNAQTPLKAHAYNQDDAAD